MEGSEIKKKKCGRGCMEYSEWWIASLHKCGCCEQREKGKSWEAEGRLEGGQVHYGWGEEFTLESSRGASVHSGSMLWWLVSEEDDWQLAWLTRWLTNAVGMSDSVPGMMLVMMSCVFMCVSEHVSEQVWALWSMNKFWVNVDVRVHLWMCTSVGFSFTSGSIFC